VFKVVSGGEREREEEEAVDKEEEARQ